MSGVEEVEEISRLEEADSDLSADSDKRTSELETISEL